MENTATISINLREGSVVISGSEDFVEKNTKIAFDFVEKNLLNLPSSTSIPVAAPSLAHHKP